MMSTLPTPDLADPIGADVSPDAALLRLGHALKQRGYRFTTVTPATHSRVNKRVENTWARCIEDVIGWSRPFLEHVVPAELFASMQAAGTLVRHEQGWRCTVRFSTLNDELFVHSAYPTHATDAVFFGPDTYRFAAALSTHLEQRERPVQRAVDIGTGAGPGAVVVARRHPKAEVLAVDINDAALRLTALNARFASASNVRCVRSDLLSGVDGRFDLIVANPPYLLDKYRRAYRQGGGALGEGMSLSIADLARDRLSPGGTLLLYTGSVIVGGVDAFHEAMKCCLDRAGLSWSYRELDPDVFGEELLEPVYAKADRIAAVLVTATRSG